MAIAARYAALAEGVDAAPGIMDTIRAEHERAVEIALSIRGGTKLLDDRPERAWRAIRAGLRILADVEALSPWFEAQFHRPFRVGVGVHVGDVVVGAVGAGDRRKVGALMRIRGLAHERCELGRDVGAVRQAPLLVA